MHEPLYRFLADDHQRLDLFLKEAIVTPGKIDKTAYDQFRAGLLKHIGMEEKILLPAAQRLRGGDPLPIASKLKLDHGALVALLVPPPTFSIISALQTILTAHNEIEEGPGGVYEICEQLADTENDSILNQLKNAPAVPVMPYSDDPNVLNATRRALTRAGYDLLIE